MISDALMRKILGASALLNLGGGILFAFPASPPGSLAGLPGDTPAPYRALTALLIWLLGGMYAWLALQPTIVRPMVGFGALGKASAFLCFVLLWLASAATLRSVVVMSADFLFAALFFVWLRGNPAQA